jgi:hypothetical protein
VDRVHRTLFCSLDAARPGRPSRNRDGPADSRTKPPHRGAAVPSRTARPRNAFIESPDPALLDAFASCVERAMSDLDLPRRALDDADPEELE